MAKTIFISQAPLRLSMGGGGTDVESYYKEAGPGAWTAATINLYARVTVSVNGLGGIITKYADKVERVVHINDIQGNALIRETLKFMKMDEWRHPLYSNPGIEINTVSAAPSRSGLGVSGAMTVGLLQILHYMQDGSIPTPQQIAEEAYHIEHDLAGSSNTGWQDQMIAAHGGIRRFEIRSGQVPTHYCLDLDRHTVAELEASLILFGTTLEREKTADESLREVLQPAGEDEAQIAEKRHRNLSYLSRIKEIGQKQLEALKKGNVHQFGRLLHRHWEVKVQYAGQPAEAIANAYEEALDAGAAGGKVIGASSQGAFMVFFCQYPQQKLALRKIMANLGMVEIPWAFEFEGARIVYTD